MDNRTLEKEYCEAMRNVLVQKNKLQTNVERRLAKASITRNYRKIAAACVIIFALVLGLVPFYKNDGLVLTVYAADGTKSELGKDDVTIKTNVSVEMSRYSKNSEKKYIHGNELFLFLIGCDDERVKQITYQIEGESTAETLDDMSDNRVWFAEQLTFNKEEYAQKWGESNAPGIYASLQNPDTGIYTAYSYIGSSYSVSAENQYEKKYCIEFETCTDADGWYAASFNIDVLIEMKDGTFAEKKLCCQPVVCGEYDGGMPVFELRMKEI